MLHIRSSVKGVFLLENFGVPIALVTDFGEPIEFGSLCIDRDNDDLYILKNGLGWVKIEGGSGTSGGVLGPARDGTYEDGLFPFTPLTPVGYAVDDINELLVALVPASAPDLSDWTGTISGDVSGKLSFDTANPIVNYVAADTAPSNPVSVDEEWNITGKRLGIIDATGSTISGVLNNQVTANINGAYEAKTFGKADKGVINVILNNVLIDTLDLTSSSNAISTTNLSVSAEMPSIFPSGAEFPDFINRTGTWTLQSDNTASVLGYNYVIVEHDTGNEQFLLDRFEFIVDDNVTATSFSGESLNNLSLSGAKYLSGVAYYTGGEAKYDINIDNMYRNTYYAGANAITHAGNTNSYGTLLSASQQALAANGGNELQQVVISQKTATITSSSVRLIDEAISLNTTARRTIQGNTTTIINSGNNSIPSILLDNVAANSTNTIENFNDENYRLTSNLDYDMITDITTLGTWDSQNWLLTDGVSGAMVGYHDGLQVIDGGLSYPNTDFTTLSILNAPTFNDGGTLGAARDYTSASGDRTYVRYFRQVSPTTANFIINISGSGGTFVSSDTSITGTSNIHLEIKAPTETGWMDAYKDFATGNFGDGDGARSSTDGAGRDFNTNWGLTIGTKSTANSSGYVVIKITVGSNFTGEITGINFTFN